MIVRTLTVVAGLAITGVGVVGLLREPPPPVIDRAGIAGAVRKAGETPAAAILTLAADSLSERFQSQAEKAAADGMTTLDSTLRRATTNRRDAAPRAVQVTGLSTPPTPPILASVLFPPEGFPLPMSIARGTLGTGSAGQAEAAVKAHRPALEAAGHNPVVVPAQVEATPVVVILQGLPPGSRAPAAHALVLDVATLARPVLEPVGTTGISIALTDRDGRMLAAAGPALRAGDKGALGVPPSASQTLPWGGGALRLALVQPSPPDTDAMIVLPPPDPLRQPLAAAAGALGLLIAGLGALRGRGGRA